MTAGQMRAIGLIGLGAMFTFVVAFALDPTPPGAGTSGSAVISHGMSFDGLDRAAAVLFGVSAAGLLTFIAGVRHWFETISSAPRWWATAMLAGGVATGTMLALTSSVFFTLASENGLSPEVARVLNDLVNYGFVFSGFGVVVTVISMTATMLATGGPLGLLGRVGVIVSILQVPYLATAFFSSGPFGAGGLVTILGFGATGLFILLTSVSMLMFARLMAAAARSTR